MQLPSQRFQWKQLFEKRTLSRLTSFSLAFSMSLLPTGEVLALTINNGSTMNVESTPGTWYAYNDPGSIVINGTLRGMERNTPGGTLTGNGARVNLTATSIII